MDRSKIEECLGHVAAYKSSGQKAKVWAQANGVPLAKLSAWCGYAKRWQAQLQGMALPERQTSAHHQNQKAAGFVAARLPSTSTEFGHARIELQTSNLRLELSWPLTHAAELARWVKALQQDRLQ